METSYMDQLPIVNRTYKDTLFRMIFREKRNLLQLYNALNGTNYYRGSRSGNCYIRKCYLYEYEK